MAYKIEWGNNNVHIKYSGDININDLFKVGGLISSDLRYESLSFVISDFLDVKSLIFSELDIKNISTRDAIPSILNPNIKLSVVSNNDNIQEMVMKYIELMKVNEWEIKLFDNLEESSKWGKQ